MRTVATLIILGLFVPVPALAQNISVTGDALVTVAPDRILITFGATTRHLDLTVAKNENDSIMTRTLAALTTLGLTSREIETDSVTIQQRWASDGERFLGYTVNNMVMVTVATTDRVEPVISAALGAGINYLAGVDFQVKELKMYREQAREIAARAAREKADKMAAALGERVGRVLQVGEDDSGTTYRSGWNGSGMSRDRSMSQNGVSVGTGGELTETLAFGTIGIRARVRVLFALEPRQE
jgi:uncharacterized protein YggE